MSSPIEVLVDTDPDTAEYDNEPLTLNENTSSSYAVVLGQAPPNNLTLQVSSDNAAVTVDTNNNMNGAQNTLVFTPMNWNTQQTVTVRAAQDQNAVDEAAVLSNAGHGLVTKTVRVFVEDDEATGVDYDVDNDGLIEISLLQQLDAIRWDSDGNGIVDSNTNESSYRSAFAGSVVLEDMGCPDGSDSDQDGECTGYELTNNLNFDTDDDGDVDANDAGSYANWLPINAYSAIFDGNGHIVSNLTINSNDGLSHIGLFKILRSGGVIRHLGMADASVTGGGLNYGVGTLAGENYGTIAASYALGGVVTVGTNGGARIGGLVGRSSGAIRASYSTAVVAGGASAAEVGGLVGRLHNGSIIASYSDGAVSASGGSAHHGGLVGVARGNASTLTNSHCGVATGQSSCIGAQLGGATGLSVQRRTTRALQQPTSATGIYEGWDNLDVDGNGEAGEAPWDFGTAYNHPALKNAGHVPATQRNDYDADDDGLVDITTLAQLNAVRWDLDGDGAAGGTSRMAYFAAGAFFNPVSAAGAVGIACPTSSVDADDNDCEGYELLNDLDFDTDDDGSTHTNGAGDQGDDYYNGGSGWSPIGPTNTQISAHSHFRAKFDGNGHIIDNLFVNPSNRLLWVGLFSGLSDAAVVTSLGLPDAHVNAAGGHGTGGLASGTLAGQNQGRIAAVWSSGAVSTGQHVGGLVGRQSGGTIVASYSTASVSCSNTRDAGGLVGRNQSSSTIVASYSTGSFSSCGNSYGLTLNSGTVTASYWDTTLSRIADDNDLNAPEGKSTSVLQAPTSYDTPAGDPIYAAWDDQDVDGDGTSGEAEDDDVWDFGRSNAHPVLKHRGRAVARQLDAQPASVPSFGAGTVTDKAFILNELIQPFQVPAATSGNGVLTYMASGLPIGLVFDADGSGVCAGTAPRMVCGTPTRRGGGPVTITVSDADTSMANDEGTLTFNVNVEARAPVVTQPRPLLETNLQNALIRMVLSGGSVFADARRGNFELITTIPGLSISGVAVSDGSTYAELTLSYDGTDFDVNKSLVVRISGESNSGNSDQFSSIITVQAIDEPAPSAPTALTAIAGDGEVGLSWSHPSDGTITGYELRRRQGSGSWTAWTAVSGSDKDTISHTASGLVNGTSYVFELRAVNAKGRNRGKGAASRVSAWPNAPRDHDSDNDGLIDVSTLAQLNAIRWDLNGDGAPDSSAVADAYYLAYPHPAPSAAGLGCGLKDHDSNPSTPKVRVCTGYELNADLNFDTGVTGRRDDDQYSNGGSGWLPIGRTVGVDPSSFSGTFKGNGRILSNLYIRRLLGYQGLFARLGGGARIDDVGLVGVDIETTNAFVGSLAAVISPDAEISSSYATGSVSGSVSVGGLVGISNLGVIKSSYAAVLINSSASRRISTTAGFGGLVGQNNGGEISASYAIGGTNILNRAQYGGLTGISVAYSGKSPVVANSYWDTETTGTSSPGRFPAGFASLPVGQTSSALKTPVAYGASPSIYAAWDEVDDVWDFGTSAQYPVLNNDRDATRDTDVNAQFNLQDASLSSLTLSSLSSALSPSFAAGTTSYTAGVAAGTSMTTVAATAAQGGAVVAIAPADADLDVAGHQVDVSAAATTITVEVTAPNGVSTRTYSVAVGKTGLSIDSPSVTEGDAGSVNLTFTVSLSPASAQTVTVGYAEQTGGTATSGTDYTALPSGTLTFSPGETSKTVTVSVTGDATDEPDETVLVALSGATNAAIGTGTGTGTIIDDDGPPSLTIDSPRVTEGDAGSVNLTFTVSLSPASAQTVTVGYAEQTGGTATSGTDYTALPSGTLTFSPGETSKTVTVSVTGDATDEPDETVLVALSGATNATVWTGTGTGTITDDEVPLLAIVTTFTTEPSVLATSDGNVSIVVRLDIPSWQVVTVRYADAGTGTATSGTDYVAITPGILTFPAGHTQKLFTVKVKKDTTDEPDETVVMKLSGATNALIGGETSVLRIGDSNSAPTVTLALTPSTIDELDQDAGEPDTSASAVSASLSHASAEAIMVTVSAAAGANAASGDFALSRNRALSIAAGATSSTGAVTVSAVDNAEDGADKQVTVSGTVSGGVLRSASADPSSRTLTIRDDDGVPTVGIDSPSVLEGNSGEADLDFTVSLSAASGKRVTVRYAVDSTDAGTATSGTDYEVPPPRTLTFVAGQSSKTVTVKVKGDAVKEPDETVRLTLSGPTNATLDAGKTTGVGTITDDDATPSVSISSPSVEEGDSGQAHLDFTVSLSSASGREVTVKYAPDATDAGTAAAGADYAAVTETTLTFAAGETSKTARVLVTGDALNEPDETVRLTLSSPTNATLDAGKTTGVGTITDDDDPPTVSIGSASVAEGDSGEADLDFTVSLSAASGRAVTVKYAVDGTDAGTATSGTDYEAVTETTLTFTAGQTSRTVTVKVKGDALNEPNETVRLTLSEPGNATLGSASTGVGTITDDDDPPTVSIGSASVTEGDTNPADLDFTVSLSAASGRAVTVKYAVDGTDAGTATSGTDYEAVTETTLTFTAGQTSRTVTVKVTGDTTDEPDETVRLTLSSPTNATLDAGKTTGVGTITDDDDPPGVALSVSPGSIAENGGTAAVSASLTGSTTSSAATTVTVTVSGTGGYTVPSSANTITIAAGSSSGSGTVTITAVDNDIDAADLSTTVTGTAANVQGIASATATAANLTITDNDAAALTVSAGTLSTAEDGTADTFTVRLASEPTAAVTVAIASGDTDEATVSPSSIVFGAAADADAVPPVSAWDAAQTVTVTGVDDDVADGAQTYAVTVDPSSADALYNALQTVSRSGSNADDDAAGLALSEVASPRETVSEAGAAAAFKVALSTEPTAAVTVEVTSDDGGECRVSKAGDAAPSASTTLTFAADAWDTAQEVTLTGVDDFVDDGDQDCVITADASSSGDSTYNDDAKVPSRTVAVRNTDNDAAALTVSAGTLSTAEDGTADTFTVRLASEPTAAVTVAIASGDTDEATVSPSSIVFGAAADADAVPPVSAWDAAQTVTVTGVDDDVADGAQTYAVTVDPSSADALYNALQTVSRSGSNADDDAAGLALSEVASPRETVSEAGAAAAFKVALSTEPTAAVTVEVTSDDGGECRVSKAGDAAPSASTTLTFAADAWDTAQEVTLTGVDDFVDDGDQDCVITADASSSGDSTYNDDAKVPSRTVAVRNTDNDAAALTVSAGTLSTAEDGTADTFTVRLASEPTAAVTVAIASGDTDEATVSPSSIVFGAAADADAVPPVSAWDAAQTVTVTGVDDDVADGAQTYAVTVDPSSADALYNALQTVSRSGSNADDDAAGLALSEVASPRETVSEAGAAAAFKVALSTEPTAAVTVEVTSDDGGECRVSKAGDAAPSASTTLTFAADAWDTAQEVTLTGVDDFVDDGDQDCVITADASSSGDSTYNDDAKVPSRTVAVRNTDNDAAALTVSAGTLSTAEDGTADTFTVRLASEPTAAVTVAIASGDTDEATVSPSSIVFGAAADADAVPPVSAWDAAQTVTVTGVDDDVADGAQTYAVTVDPSSADALYNALQTVSRSGSNADDDAAGLALSEVASPRETVSEAGAAAAFKVALSTEPTAAVTVEVTSDDGGECRVSKAGDAAPSASTTLTFAADAWDTAQEVTLTGVDDFVDDGDQDCVITADASSSGDSTYNDDAKVPSRTVAVRNTDNDAAALTVSAGTLSTAEDGTADTFTVRLASEPTAAVTVAIASGDTDEATVSPSSIVFGAAADADAVPPVSAWDAAQTVTVTGVDDDVADGAQTYAVTVDPSSADALYNALQTVSRSGSNADDDAAGLALSEVASPRETVSEAGAAAAFKVALSTEPTAAVTVEVTSDDGGECRVSKAGDAAPSASTTLTFAADAWDTAQEVTLTGVDDFVDDGDQDCVITADASSSGDSTYNDDAKVPSRTVAVRNTDNDAAALTVSAGTLSTAEDGTADTFTVRLASEPTAAVTVAIASGDTDEATVSPSSIVFGAAADADAVPPVSAWDAAQTVTVTGVDDDVADGAQTYAVTVDPSSADALYNALQTVSRSGSNADDDAAGLALSEVASPRETVSEAGAAAAFKVALSTEPTAAVTVEVTSDDGGECRVSKAGDAAPSASTTLTFAADAWDTAQEVTLTGVDDFVDDGDQDCVITADASSSGDSTYNDDAKVPSRTVAVRNTDNDAAALTVSAGTLSTAEDGTADTFTVRLASEPTAAVTVAIASGDTDEATVSPSSIVFGAAADADAVPPVSAWDAAQTVTVTGVDDDVADGAQTYAVTVDPSSADALYNALQTVSRSGSNADDDAAGLALSEVASPRETVSEAGAAAAFKVALSTEPTAAVTVEVTSDDGGECRVSKAGDAAPSASTTLTFAADAWDTAQEVTLTGVDDFVDDGDQDCVITADASSSGDSTYNDDAKVPSRTVAVRNTDNDAAALTVSAGTLSTAEDGTADTFTVRLASEPTAAVTVAIASGDTDEATVSPSSIVFGAAADADAVPPVSAWDAAQTVTVTGVDDDVADGAQTYAVTVDPSSADALYNALQTVSRSGSNADDDAAGLALSEVASPRETVSEAGAAAAFKVALSTEPTAAVTVEVTSDDGGECRVSKAGDAAPSASTTLTFAADAWDTAQEVTLTGVDDFVDDGDQDCVITADASSSGDSTYNDDAKVPSRTVAVRNTDNDAAALTVSAGTLSTAEDGTADTFTVRLASEPTAAVTVAIASGDTDEATVSPSSIVFGAAADADAVPPVSAWDAAQTVTVTGVDDDVADGAQTYAVTVDPSSADALYNALQTVSRSGSNADDDAAGLALSEVASPRETVSEAGAAAAFKVALSTEPTAAVTVEVTSDDGGECRVSKAGDAAPSASTTLTFAADAWDTAQEVTLTGVDDFVDDGDQDCVITADASSSGDSTYNDDAKVPSRTVAVRNTDNDAAALTVSAGTLSTAEDGTADTFTVRLASEPTAAVTVAIASGDTDEATVSPSSIVFGAAADADAVPPVSAWDAAQTVTVTGVDDDVADGAQTYAVTVDPSSADALYNALQTVSRSGSNADDDAAGLALSEVASPRETVSEAGAAAAFKVALSTEPTAAVTVEVTSDDGGECRVSKAGDAAPSASTTLTFAADAWDTAQEVTLTGVDDFVDDGDQDCVITADASSSGDSTYNDDAKVPSRTVAVRNTDNDAAALTVSAGTLSTAEDGTADTFTVRLASEPTAAVTVAIASGDTDEATVSPSSIVFGAAADADAVPPVSAWDAAQTVTVTGVDDDVADGAQTYAVTVDPSSADALYNALQTVSRSGSNADDDAAGLALSEVASPRETVSEAGAAAAFKVALSTRADGGGDGGGDERRRRRVPGVEGRRRGAVGVDHADLRRRRLGHGAGGDADRGGRLRGRRRPGLRDHGGREQQRRQHLQRRREGAEPDGGGAQHGQRRGGADGVGGARFRPRRTAPRTRSRCGWRASRRRR